MTISLRQAHMNDNWRRLYKKKYPLLVREILIQSGEIFNNLKLSLNGNLNIIIGKNGVGKTNFLRNIFNALNKEGESNRTDFNKLLDKNDILFKYEISNSEKEYQYIHQDESSKDNNTDLLGFIFDPCSLIPELQNIFQKQQNFEEILDQFEALEYSFDQITELNYLANQTYTSVVVYNIEDEYGEFPILPIFKVKRGGLEYDSRAMGLGELSMLYFYWMIQYISSLEKNILIIIEEPESFISPLLQTRFVNILVKYIFEKNINCIMSTHSDYILNRVPASSLKKLHYSPSLNLYKFTVIKNLDILSTLGLSPIKKGVLFFEDEAAEIFLKQLIAEKSLNAVENFYFHCSGDDSHIILHINEMPKQLTNFKFVGVFDGDARNKVPNLLKDNPIHIFLPTNNAPEKIIIDYLVVCDFEIIDSFLHLENGKFEEAFQTATGADHHELFKDIARILSMDYQQLFKQLCQIWIKDESSRTEVLTFIDIFDNFFNH
ncbi:ATP-binding protein [Acinetobacter oleivorans]|uniref:ATP-dependent nuclease n=1 Tax=Acinetobacter oleivorans TaxID=1148157 RepID=UPI00178CCF9A|nr:AAA family ATPase [Acinetobacter oleivorans]MBE2171737.1 ATP-binding protein [Acinetobacter oleivorans]